MSVQYKILGQIFYGVQVVPGRPYIPGTETITEDGYIYVTPGQEGTPDTMLVAPQVIYTVPEGKQSIITSIFVSNHDSAARTYDLAVVPKNESLSLKHHVRWDIPLKPYDTDIVSSKITMSAGDKLYVFPSTIDRVAFTVCGIEQ